MNLTLIFVAKILLTFTMPLFWLENLNDIWLFEGQIWVYFILVLTLNFKSNTCRSEHPPKGSQFSHSAWKAGANTSRMKGLSTAQINRKFLWVFFFFNISESSPRSEHSPRDSLIIRQLWEPDRTYLTLRGRWGNIYLRLHFCTPSPSINGWTLLPRRRYPVTLPWGSWTKHVMKQSGRRWADLRDGGNRYFIDKVFQQHHRWRLWCSSSTGEFWEGDPRF